MVVEAEAGCAVGVAYAVDVGVAEDAAAAARQRGVCGLS